MDVNLVTGGSGYLGSALVRRLCSEGRSVRVFDISDSPDRPDSAEFFRGDVRDLNALRKACRDADVIYHNAALVPLTKAGKAFREVNVRGTANVLEAAKKQGVRKIVHSSSSAIYGAPEHCPINESTPPHPVESYGRSKLEAERVMLSPFGSGRPFVTLIRPRTIVGTGRLGIFQILFSWIRAGRNVYTIGAGDSPLQLVHIDDLVDSMLLASLRDKHEVYNIGAARYSSLREDLTALCRHAGTGARVKGLPVWPSILALRLLDIMKLSPLAPWHYLTYHKPFYFDISRATERLGWRPRYSNEEMLIEAYDTYASAPAGDGASTSMHRTTPAQKLLKVLRWLS